MRIPFLLLLAGTQLTVPRVSSAQPTADTLPERVVAQAYKAYNRADADGYYSFFAPVWYHSVLEDTAGSPTRHTREEEIRDLSRLFEAAGVDKPKVRALRRAVLGPYVVDEQAFVHLGERGAMEVLVHFDMFEVRRGKIVHEWESGPWRTAKVKPTR